MPSSSPGRGPAAGPVAAPDRLLSAASQALSAGQPQQALAHLSGLSDPALSATLPRPMRAALQAFRGHAMVQLGNPAAAAQAFRQALRLDRQDPGLACSLGAALHQAGRLEEALAAFREGIRRDRRFSQAAYGSGVVLHALARHGDAAQAFRQAIRLAPDLLEARENLALTLSAAGDGAAADMAWQEAMGAFPPEHPARPRLAAGQARHLAATGRPAAALPLFRAARAGMTSSGGAGDQLDLDLATALLEAGQAQDAADLFDSLANRNADAGLLPGLLSGLGAARLAIGEPEAALAALRRALALDPDHRAANLHAGHALQALGDLSAAIVHHRRALAGDSAYLPGVLGLANVLAEAGEVEAADAAFAQAEAVLPGDAVETPALRLRRAQLSWNRGLHDLLLARYARGWAGYAWRWLVPDFPTPPRDTGLPSWDGLVRRGQHLYVWDEQGPGDMIMFASCLPELVEAGASVTLAADSRLCSLFARSFPAVQVLASRQAPPAADAAVPIGDLPRHFRCQEAAFPNRRSYLSADPDAVAGWRERWRAAAGPGLRIVALSWKGGVTAAERRRRGAGLADWAPLLRLPGIAWVNLQFGTDAAAEFAAAAAELGFATVTGPDPAGDLDVMAAAVTAADGVASMANTLVHLAGALGRPTLVAVPAAPSWRWQRQRLDSPWYPAIGLVRQARGESWAAVIQRMAAALPALLGGPGDSAGDT